jgi:hypothetical protein
MASPWLTHIHHRGCYFILGDGNGVFRGTAQGWQLEEVCGSNTDNSTFFVFYLTSP